MMRSALSLALLFAPVLALGYYHLGKLLLRSTEAAQFLNGGGGSIDTQELHDYESYLTVFVYFGLLSAVLLAFEVARLLQLRLPNRTMQADRPSTDR